MPQGSMLLAVALLLGVAIGLVLRRFRVSKKVAVTVALVLVAVGVLLYALRAR